MYFKTFHSDDCLLILSIINLNYFWIGTFVEHISSIWILGVSTTQTQGGFIHINIFLFNPAGDQEKSSVAYCSKKNHNFANTGHKNMNDASF